MVLVLYFQNVSLNAGIQRTGFAYSGEKTAFYSKVVNVDGGCVFRSMEFPNANLAALRLGDLEELYCYEPSPITESNKEKKEQLFKRERRISKRDLDLFFENMDE